MKEESTTKGVSLIELVIAIAVLSLGISASVMLAFANQTLRVDAGTNSEALTKAETLLEGERADSRLDFGLVNPIPPTADGIYTKQVNVETLPDFFTKKVTSIVSWLGENNRHLSIQLSTLVTDPTGPNGGNTCNSVLSGDWTHPQLLGSADVGQNNGGTDVDIYMGKAYVTADASAAGKDDLYIINITNPNLSPLPTIASVNTGPGLMAVHVDEKYAYVANKSTVAELQIIDIDPISTGYMTYSTHKIPGNTGASVGNSIFYNDNTVYLGLTKTPDTGASEFNIVDVTNRATPIWRGSYRIGHDINSIYVKGKYAYIGSPHDQELIILDISDPTDPNFVGSIDLPDDSANGKSIAIVGNILYLGRTEGASPSTKELQVIDILNPALPTGGSSGDVDSTVNAIAIRDNLAFMITADPNLGFQIWDLNTMTLYGSENVEQTSTGGLDCEGNYIYIAQRSNKALQIVGPGN